MVEINNQRKAFLDMGVNGYGRQKTEINHDVIVGGELFTGYDVIVLKLIYSQTCVTPNHSQTCHAKQAPENSNWWMPDATSFFPVGGMPTASRAWPERLLSEKSGRCGIAAD
ncbi:hypothetical protein TNCV_990571 [Trichonephila clavipes]|nr:hypothetical protein TNCV_990571 [Trichonephila clavipes]